MIVEPVISSGMITTTATTVVCSGPCLVSSVLLNPGTAATTLSLIDPSGQGVLVSTSGTVITQLVAPANANIVPHDLTRPLEFKNGCIVVLSGAASTAAVYFSKIGG